MIGKAWLTLSGSPTINGTIRPWADWPTNDLGFFRINAGFNPGDKKYTVDYGTYVYYTCVVYGNAINLGSFKTNFEFLNLPSAYKVDVNGSYSGSLNIVYS